MPRPTFPLQPGTPLACAFLLLGLLCAVLSVAPTSARAAGSPNLSLAVDAQDVVLYGKDSSVSLTASTPSGAASAYNLSYRAVLPSGVLYVPGSAGSLAGEPTRVANQPGTGQTTLLWVNVADLAGGTSHTLDFRVTHSTAAYGVQGSFQVRGDAYAQNNRLHVPPFTAAGAADTGAAHPSTATAEDVRDSSKLAAMTVTKDSEGTPDDEILRGVHKSQPIFTITVRSNAVAPMTSVNLFDYLPAGLEYLGCGGAGSDHTTNAPTNSGSAQEYPGSGAISVPAITGCTAPVTVQSSSFDPDGAGTAFSSGVFTEVRWNLGTVSPNAVLTYRFRAAIPLRRNTATWPAPVPSTSGAQAANLNNNSGSEVADEEALTSYSKAQGFYNGNAGLSLTGDTTLKRFAEDLAVKKTARTSGLAQGTTVLWDLDVRTSEYRDGSDVVVTDTVPDGLCPLRSGGPLTAGSPSTADTAECSSAGPTPSVPYTSATELSSGAWTVIWNQTTDPALAQLAPGTTHTITFPTATRSHYQEAFEDAGAVLSGDVAVNNVLVAGSARVVCASGAACPVGSPTGTEIAHDGPLATGVTDTSADRITAALPTLDKKVATTSGDCSTAAYTDGVSAPAYRPGDRICWKLRVDYPALLASQGDTLVDYLPPTLAFDSAFGTMGEQPTAADTAGAGPVDATTASPGPGGELRWTIPGAVGSGAVFERRIATRAKLPAGSSVGDLSTNLFKSSSLTTGAANVALRDTAPWKLSMPVMSTQKRVVALGGTDLPTPVATQVVRGGDVVKFQVLLSNSSDDTAAERLDVWDRLPAGVTCADVTASGGSISAGGICDGSDNTVKWGNSPSIGPDVPASGNLALTYTVRVPTTTRPTQILTSSAGIRQYETTTNTGGAFTYVPAANVDPSQASLVNVPSAGSAATLTGAEPTIAETRTTTVTETQAGVEYNTVADATIGETIHYKVTTVVPAGITVDHFRVTDTVDARHTFLPATLTLTAGTLPAGGTLTTSGSDITLDLGASWTAPTGTDSTFTFEFDGIVADSVDTFRTGLPMSNQAKLGYDNPTGSPARNETLGAAATTNVVEPVMTVDKTVDVGGTPVIGGQIVEYTVKVGAATGNASPAHETTLVEDVPVGLTVVDQSGVPVADGATVPDGDPALPDGVWSQGTRRITFAPDATIYPGSLNTFRYKASVDIPPVSGTSLTTLSTTRTTSLAGTPAAPAVERSVVPPSPRTVGYEATKAVTLTARTPSITTTASPSTLTPGEQATYTTVVTIPANTIAYDVFARDALPPEMEFDEHLSQVCTAGCSSGATTPTVQRYTPFTSGGNTQVVAWDLGDVTTSSPQPRTIELKYKAHLRTTRRTVATTIIRPAVAQNAATVASNRTDRVGAFTAGSVPAPAGGFNDTSAVANALIVTVEPVLALDKQIAVNASGYGTAAVTVHNGDAMRYRVTVRNTGDSPAYDVEVRDVPPAKYRNVTMAVGPATDFNTVAWAQGGPIGWTIPGPIAPNSSVVLDYTADLPLVTDLRDNDALVNTATIQHGWGVSIANRTARPGPQFDYRDYSVASIPALTRSTTAIYDGPTISVVKTTGLTGFPKSGAAEVNKPFTWRVTVTNTSGTAAARNLTVRDTLPRDWTYEAGTSGFTAGTTVEPTVTPNATGDTLVWNTTTPLAPGASVLLTYQARATKASATSIGTGLGVGARHINSATASVIDAVGAPADAGGPFSPAAPDTAYAQLVVPIISVAKTPDAPALPAAATGAQGTAGTTVAYMIKVKNTGTAAATNVVVTDTLPVDGIPNTYAAGTATATGAATGAFSELSADDTTAKFRIASLPVNGTVDIRVPVRTDPAAAENSDLVNTSSVDSDQTTAVTDTGTYRLVGSADLRASKTAPAAVEAGRTLTYTIGATNLGPSVARDIVLTDALPSSVTFMSAPGCARSGQTVTCSVPGATAVGAEVTRTITVRVRTTGAPTNADNTVIASTATADPVATNNTATAAVAVGEVADLALAQTITGGAAGATPAAPWTKRVVRGDEVSFDLTVVNHGPSDALAASIVDTLPAGLTYVSDTGGCTYASGIRKLTCPIAGGLMAYEPSSPTPLPTDVGAPKTITVVTKATGLGTHTNGAEASGSPTLDATPADNTAAAVVTIDPSVHLGLGLTVPATVGAGELLTFTAVATNDGKDTASDARISMKVPAGTAFSAADSAAGCTVGRPTPDVAGDPDVVTCAIGDLPGIGPDGRTGRAAGRAGGTASRRITFRVPVALADQAITGNAVVESKETDDASPGDALYPVLPAAASASTQVGPAADLSITQDAPAEVAAGGSVTYTLVVRNDGPSTAPNVVVTDQLPAGVTLRLATSSTGSCGEAGGVVTCSLGALSSGTSTVLTITVDLPAALAGRTLANTATVRSDVVDPTPANASSSLARRLPDPPPPATPAPTPAPTPTPAPEPEAPIVPGTANLVLSKKAEGVARAGRELSYSITVFNRGPATATDTVVTDALVGGVEFKNARSGSGVCGFENGTVRCKVGAVAANESVNMRVIVVPSKTGSLVNDAVVSSKVVDPDMADNRAVAANTVSPRPPTKLSVKTTASTSKLRGGARITYTVKVRNTGKNEAAAVEMCDKLPAGMSFTSTKGGVLKGSRLCLTQPMLAPGKTATFKVKVRLSARARKGAVVNRVSADAENAALQSASATGRIVTDGKVSAGAVRGFTG